MYEYSLGLNGLGACATQYSSEYMDVTVVRDKTQYTLHFEKGENVGGLQKSETRSVQTGTVQKCNVYCVLSRTTVTSIYSLLYCVAHAPRP